MPEGTAAGRSSFRSPRITIIAVAAVYIAVLAGVDAERHVFGKLAALVPVLLVLALASSMAFVLRFVRWRLLLASFGHCVPFQLGFLAYLSGFAFTASPGKVGELIRIRYFSHMGVPHARVVACFVFERLLDLFVLLMFASLIANRTPGLTVAVMFVLLVLLVVVLVARSRRLSLLIQHRLRSWGQRRPARWSRTLLRGIAQTGQFLTVDRLAPATALGLAAWGVQCLGYTAALLMLGIELPWWILFAVPPASMLIGAASMMPGGIGTTEAATVVLLTGFGVELDRALLAAITLRLGSLWFAVLLGFTSVSWLERKQMAR